MRGRILSATERRRSSAAGRCSGEGDRTNARSAVAMLSVPTLWTVFVVNFLAVGLVWAYVARSYPKFDAAWFWAGSAFAAAVGAGSATLRMVATDSLLPLLAGGT